jgi:hypothetical protein
VTVTLAVPTVTPVSVTRVELLLLMLATDPGTTVTLRFCGAPFTVPVITTLPPTTVVWLRPVTISWPAEGLAAGVGLLPGDGLLPGEALALGLALGEALALGLALGEALALGLAPGEGLAAGLPPGDGLAPGLPPGDGLAAAACTVRTALPFTVPPAGFGSDAVMVVWPLPTAVAVSVAGLTVATFGLLDVNVPAENAPGSSGSLVNVTPLAV